VESGELDSGCLDDDGYANENDEIADDGGDRNPGAKIQTAFNKDFFDKPFLDFSRQYEKKNKENQEIEKRPDGHPVPTGGEKG
jgi:hypothetical protein